MTKSQIKRLKELAALREAARARGDWKTVFEIITDERFVLFEGKR